ncbi:unnamed protein product [Rotaria socialis]|uniref:Uncharacterized protein n=1 Tax=Rotaria socialis TaxID=392032 RepID=A0A818AUD9_9BILA|nr:unnamed protein product [Rotaria socialis]CAF3228864.1 unnamed protein product [Rotaria socialis]CAF3344239.1 unnamed protein product [Rotaria socialis]CAF3408836.1 unnamed protein product [Rotaria socialis]CAF3435803.1 unnamed protein product [Rotaria socialis]
MSSSGSLGTGDIIGISVGGVLAVVSIIGIIVTCYSLCCNNKSQSKVQPNPSYRNQPNPSYRNQPNLSYQAQPNPSYQAQPNPLYQNQPNPYGQQINHGYYAQQQPWPPQQQYGNLGQMSNGQRPVYQY